MANRIAAVEQSEKSRALRDFLWTAMREEQGVQENGKPAERPPAVQPAPVITRENSTETENRSLSPFSFDGKNIRVIEVDGEPYWVVKDVAEALEYPDSTIKSITRLIDHVPDEWKRLYRIQTNRGGRDIATFSEQGLYFFVARSDKPKAISFQKWVAGEVLPAIRKTGNYRIGNGAPQLEHQEAGRQESPVWLYDGPLVDLRWKAPSSRSQTAGGYLVVFEMRTGGVMVSAGHDPNKTLRRVLDQGWEISHILISRYHPRYLSLRALLQGALSGIHRVQSVYPMALSEVRGIAESVFGEESSPCGAGGASVPRKTGSAPE